MSPPGRISPWENLALAGVIAEARRLASTGRFDIQTAEVEAARVALANGERAQALSTLWRKLVVAERMDPLYRPFGALATLFSRATAVSDIDLPRPVPWFHKMLAHPREERLRVEMEDLEPRRGFCTIPIYRVDQPLVMPVRGMQVVTTDAVATVMSDGAFQLHFFPSRGDAEHLMIMGSLLAARRIPVDTPSILYSQICVPDGLPELRAGRYVVAYGENRCRKPWIDVEQFLDGADQSAVTVERCLQIIIGIKNIAYKMRIYGLGIVQTPRFRFNVETGEVLLARPETVACSNLEHLANDVIEAYDESTVSFGAAAAYVPHFSLPLEKPKARAMIEADGEILWLISRLQSLVGRTPIVDDEVKTLSMMTMQQLMMRLGLDGRTQQILTPIVADTYELYFGRHGTAGIGSFSTEVLGPLMQMVGTDLDLMCGDLGEFIDAVPSTDGETLDGYWRRTGHEILHRLQLATGAGVANDPPAGSTPPTVGGGGGGLPSTGGGSSSGMRNSPIMVPAMYGGAVMIGSVGMGTIPVL